ncbi:MAG: phage baseplate protein [Fusobacteriaceae bacterium]
MIILQCYAKELEQDSQEDFFIVLETVTGFEISDSNSFTNRRIESGFEITDNALTSPQKISISGMVCDINQGETGMFKMKNMATADMVRYRLEAVLKDRMFCTIIDLKHGKEYYNFLISSKKITAEAKATFGYNYNLEFQEVRIGTIGELSVTVSKDKDKSATSTSPSKDGKKGQGGAKPPTNGEAKGSQSVIKRVTNGNFTGNIFTNLGSF